MKIHIQIDSEHLQINGTSLDEVIANAVTSGIEQFVKMQKTNPQERITFQDLATFNKCSVKTIERRVKEKNIRSEKIGKHRTITRKDAEKFLFCN